MGKSIEMNLGFGQFYKKFILGLVVLFFFSILLSVLHPTYAAPTKVINYQGKLTNANGTNVADGTYTFTLAFYNHITNSASTDCRYTAAGTFNTTSCSSITTINVTVTNGVFYIAIGDTGTNALTPVNFSEDLWMEITVNGETLTPRKRVTGSAFTFNVDNGTTNGQTAYWNSSTNSWTANSTLFYDSTNQRVGIGTTAPITQLHVPGKLPTSAAGSLTLATSPANATAMDVNGKYAYIVTNDSVSPGSNTGELRIYDISSTTPVAISTTETCIQPQSVFAKDNYIYISCTNSGTLIVANVTNPTSPTITSASVGGGPHGSSDIQGNFMYYYTNITHNFYITDISSLLSAQVRDVSALGLSAATRYGIYYHNKYAYIPEDSGANTILRIMNVTNPASPTTASTSTVLSTSNGNGYDIKFSGKYMFVNKPVTSQVSVYDISNPTSPSLVQDFSVGASNRSMFLQGRYAFIVKNGSNAVQVLDISNPASLSSVGTITTTGAPLQVIVKGRYAYVSTSTTLEVYDIGGAYIQQIEAGGIEVGTLSAESSVTARTGVFRDNLSTNYLKVTNNANFLTTTTNGTATFYSTTNFQSLNASSIVFTDASKNLTSTGTLGVTQGGTGTATQFTAGSVVFAGSSGVYTQDNSNFFWDDSNNRLGIGTASPSAALSVGSSSQFQVSSTGGISINSTTTATINITNSSGPTGINLSGSSSNVITYNLNGQGGPTTSLSGSAGQKLSFYNDGSNSKFGIGMSTTNLWFQSGISSGYQFFVGSDVTTPVVSFSSVGDIVTQARLGTAGLSPTYALDIKGYSASAVAGRLRGDAAGTNNNTQLIFFGKNSNADLYSVGTDISTASGTTNFEIYSLVSSKSRFSIDSSGNLGAGTATPTSLNSRTKVFDLSAADISSSGLPGLVLRGGSTFTTNPAWELHLTNPTGAETAFNINSGTVNYFSLRNSGSLGLGATAPASLNSRQKVLEISATETSTNLPGLVLRGGSTYSTNPAWEVHLTNPTGTETGFNISSGSTNVLHIRNSGNVGIGNTSPLTRLDVSGGARFNGDLLNTDSVNGLGDGGSLVANNSFEINDDATTTIADGWSTGSFTNGTYSIDTSASNGNRAQAIAVNITNSASVKSSCFPITGGRTYNLYARIKSNVAATTGMITRLWGYTSKANCTAFTSGSSYDASTATVSGANTWNDYGGSITPGTTMIWGRVELFQFTAGSTNTMSFDAVRLIPSSLTVGADLAENYFVKNENELKPGDIVMSDTSADTAYVTKATDSAKIIGIVSTQPGYLLDAGRDIPRVAVALSGRVPVKITGQVQTGDPITLSEIPGVAKKATSRGWIIGKALESRGPNSTSDSIMVFINNSYYVPEEKLAMKDNKYTMLTGSSLNTSSGAFVVDTKGNTSIASDLKVGGNTTLVNLTAGKATIKNIFASNIVTENLTAGKIMIDSNNSAPTTGSGMIKKGTNSIVIKNTNSSPKAKVFITPKTSVPYSLAVTYIQEKDSFTVTIPANATEDILFDYFIILEK